MAKRIYRPGEIVPVSGQYDVVSSIGTYQGRQVTCVKGEPIPADDVRRRVRVHARRCNRSLALRRSASNRE